MHCTELRKDQIVRKGKYPAPNVPNHNSLFFHHLTVGRDTPTYYKWGQELTAICMDENIPCYYFINDFGTKINVYPNDLIERWWSNR